MNKIKKFIHNLLRTILILFNKIVGDVHMPWTHKKFAFEDALEIISKIKIGDIILTRTKGELTTLIIPGFWKHCSINIGNARVVEATGKGIGENWVYNVLMKTDYIAIMRLKDQPDCIREIVAERAKTFIGRPYDYSLELNKEDSMYCSEVVYHSVNDALNYQYIIPMKVWGIDTFTPQDCYNARKKFDVIYEK